MRQIRSLACDEPNRKWRLAASLLPLSMLPACVQLSTGTDAGTGAASTATPGTTGGITSTVTPTGAGCTEDAVTQVTLCEQISTCPGLDVDPGVFPNCGFRIKTGSAALDLECLCGNELCPVGVPSTCADGAQLLSAQSSITVCEQSDEGRCVSLTTTGGASSTCDKNCESSCAGDPSCIQFCGC